MNLEWHPMNELPALGREVLILDKNFDIWLGSRRMDHPKNKQGYSDTNKAPNVVSWRTQELDYAREENIIAWAYPNLRGER